jgi:hypothetical protein
LGGFHQDPTKPSKVLPVLLPSITMLACPAGQGRAYKLNTTAGNKQAQNVGSLPMRMAYDYSPG